MSGETLIGLGIVIVASFLDPLLWLTLILAKPQEEDRKNRDIHIWQRNGL